MCIKKDKSFVFESFWNETGLFTRSYAVRMSGKISGQFDMLIRQMLGEMFDEMLEPFDRGLRD